jgi:hypothetical protein
VTDTERIASLEARLAAAEARIAQLEAPASRPGAAVTPLPYTPSLPQPLRPYWETQPTVINGGVRITCDERDTGPTLR